MYKKLITSGIGILLFFSPVIASADVTSQIAALQVQIQQLLAQITVLRAQTNPTPTTTSSCLSLTYDLYIGKTDAQTNGEVSKLQQFLISEGVYPEAQVTGYYGNLTAQAVMRWQKAHGMDFVTLKSGVGKMTRAKIVQSCSSSQVSNQSGLTTYSQTYVDDFEGYHGTYVYGVDYDPNKFLITKASDNPTKFYVKLNGNGHTTPDVYMTVEYVYLGNFGGSLLQYWESNAKSRLCPTCTEIVKPEISTVEKAYIDNITGASKSNTTWLLMDGGFIVSGDIDYFYPVLKTLRIIQGNH